MKKEENKAKFIGSKIRTAREEEKISQLELAKALGFESSTALSLIEGGDRNVSVENLEKIADILHRDIKYFLGKEEDKPVTVEFALRAKNIEKKDRDLIMRLVNMTEKRKNDGK
jgi:transcriptional regulator with XRE-family HTH domain